MDKVQQLLKAHPNVKFIDEPIDYLFMLHDPSDVFLAGQYDTYALTPRLIRHRGIHKREVIDTHYEVLQEFLAKHESDIPIYVRRSELEQNDFYICAEMEFVTVYQYYTRLAYYDPDAGKESLNDWQEEE